MDFKIYLEKAAKQLDREVGRILHEELKEVRKVERKLVPFVAAFKDACMGGKRIRGALVRMGYEITRTVTLSPSNSLRVNSTKGIKRELYSSPASLVQNDRSEMLKVAAAYEIMHAGILAHDDIIDESPLRRGKPSLYKNVGMPQAITLADFGFFLSFKIISESSFPAELKAKVLNLFSRIMVDTALGQMLDIGKGDPLKVAKYKTAEYTISGPLQLGAMLGGAPGKLLGRLGLFGESLGIAFQIRDDSLDGEKDRLDEANRLVASAKKMIPRLTKGQYMSKLLEQMAEYMVRRKK